MCGEQEVPRCRQSGNPGFEPTSGRPACITMHGDPAPRMRTSAAVRTFLTLSRVGPNKIDLSANHCPIVPRPGAGSSPAPAPRSLLQRAKHARPAPWPRLNNRGRRRPSRPSNRPSWADNVRSHFALRPEGGRRTYASGPGRDRFGGPGGSLALWQKPVQDGKDYARADVQRGEQRRPGGVAAARSSSGINHRRR